MGLLDRLTASLGDLAPGLALHLHVVDPHPAGGGRIWREEQSPLLWMNSMAQDITVFTDESVVCEGPITPGPNLAEWAAGPGRACLAAAGLLPAGATLDPRSFPPRGVQGEYLRWALARVEASLPDGVRITRHQERAIALDERGGGQRITLASGRQIRADAVVLAQGYLEQAPTPPQERWLALANARGLTYLPSGHTADLDLSGLRAGEPVIVRGMGLAFIDLFVLLGEGRGGHFTGSGVDLTYHPSGREPVLHVGSRRGVPYHSKLGYSPLSSTPVQLRWFTPETLAAISDGGSQLDFRSQVYPLIAQELAGAHYRRLFAAHADRTSGAWEDFEEVIGASDVTTDEFDLRAAGFVPHVEDRFRIAHLDRPLAGVTVADTNFLQGDVVAHIETDLARRADPGHSADAAVFDALLSVYAVLSAAVARGQIRGEDRVLHVEQEFHGFFSFLASGPPPRRLAELLALHRAGVIHFLGPDLELGLADDGFVASSPALAGEVHARAAVEARLPRPDVTLTTDPVVSGLIRRRQLKAQSVLAQDGTDLGGGQLLTDDRCRAVRADGSVHERLFLLGPAVSGSAGSSGFSRPGFNSPGFRQNDAVARDLLGLLAQARDHVVSPLRAASTPASSTSTTTTSTTNSITTDKDVHRHAS